MKIFYSIFIAKMRRFERCSPLCHTTYIALPDRGRAVHRKFVGVGGGLTAAGNRQAPAFDGDDTTSYARGLLTVKRWCTGHLWARAPLLWPVRA